ncbi:MAG: HD domain-containing protein [Ruminococcus sp.]|nr:HD domain-containing protein [Ruminococcus sp.]
MIYTELTIRAMNLAYAAHHGQKDRSGVPYIFHPFHLAEQMEDAYAVCAALLHDVLEDTQVTAEELRKEFPSEVTEAVELLTRDKQEDYFAYVQRLGKNPIARAVKLADLRHNMDASRIPQPTPETAEWTKAHQEKYKRAEKILLEMAQAE